MTMFSELSRPQKIRFTKLSPSARREARLGLLFISPWIIGFLVFTLIPLVASLGFSFTNLTLTQEEPLKFSSGELSDAWSRILKSGLHCW